MSTQIGEVVESNTASFVAQVPRESEGPGFGAWVEVQTRQGITLYGVVSMVEYGSTMPGRRATALGKTHEELQREMPQVMELLRTSFHGRIVGYAMPNGPVVQSLPPFPASIHDFVHPCSEDTLLEFGAPYDYVPLLLNSGDRSLPNDELLVAALKHVYPQSAAQFAQHLVPVGRVLSRLLKDDHQRLQSLLRRLQSNAL